MAKSLRDYFDADFRQFVKYLDILLDDNDDPVDLKLMVRSDAGCISFCLTDYDGLVIYNPTISRAYSARLVSVHRSINKYIDHLNIDGGYASLSIDNVYALYDTDYGLMCELLDSVCYDR